MSNDRREALRARFVASAGERLRKTWFSLIEVHGGRAEPAPVEQEVARVFHGLKGDAGLFGFDALSAAIHAAEEVLDVGNPDRNTIAIAEVLAREIETIMRALQAPPDDAATMLEGVRARLASGSPEQRPDAGPPQPQADTIAAPSSTRWVQVDAMRIDEICDRLVEFHAEFSSLANRLAESLAGNAELRWILEDLDRRKLQFDELAATAWTLRLSSVEMSLLELAQHARTLADSQGKRIVVDLQAGGVELERHILDSIAEPLIHLVRNAIDHGLEPPYERSGKPPVGTLTLHATTDGSRAEIVVADDGRGIDLDRIRAAAITKGLLAADARATTMDEAFELLFSRGFTTRSKVTELSGRGVGLDVVRNRIESLGGRVTVTSKPGAGTKFTLSVPTTIGRERYVVFEAGGVVFGLPSRSVREILQVSTCKIEQVTSGAVLSYRDEYFPFRSVDEALTDEAGRVLIIDAGDRPQALGVSAIKGELDLMRRPIDRLVAKIEYAVAAASLGDNRPVLLVAPLPFLRHLDRRSAPSPGAKIAERPRVLIVDDSPLVRGLVASLLSGIDFEVQEAADGLDALDALARDEVQLVISDVEMPAMNGFDLLRRIRVRWPHLPVVMLTTRGSSEDRRLASSLGANAYVVKSNFEQGHLVATVRRLLGQVDT